MPGLNPSQKVLDSSEYGALKKYFSSHGKDLDHTLDVFCEPVEDKFMSTGNASDVEPLLWTAWEAVVAWAASSSPSSSHKQQLADFILNIESRPTLTKGGETCVVEGMTVWKDLPILGWELREAWNFAATDQSSKQDQDHWVNVNASTSTLVESIHAKAKDHQDYSLFGIFTIRSGLEDQEQPSEVAVEAAAVWLTYASSAIWDFSKQNKSFDGKVARPGPLFKDRNWTGYCSDRWTAWEQRLDDVQALLKTERAKKLASEALEAMQKCK